MTTENLALAAALFFFIFGFLANFAAVVPGNIIAWIGILAHKLLVPEQSVSWTFFWISLGLALLAQVIDLLGGYFGARWFGATWKGAVGGMIGGIVGMIFFNIPGLIIGPIAGVIIAEMAQNGDLRKAGKAGLGGLLGSLLGIFVRVVLTCAMIAGFFLSLRGWF